MINELQPLLGLSAIFAVYLTVICAVAIGLRLLVQLWRADPNELQLMQLTLANPDVITAENPDINIQLTWDPKANRYGRKVRISSEGLKRIFWP